MAKKAELLEQAKKLKLTVTDKNTIAEIEKAIAESGKAEKVQPKEHKAEVAKAGKRSAKALEETAEKALKEERKATSKETVEKPKTPVKPTRTKLERRGKNFRKSAELIDRSKVYSASEALGLVVKTSHVKFDASVELHINLGVDPRQADQNIRDNLVLPAGTGKTVRVAAFTDDKVAGADVSGVESITKALDKSEINFDVLVSSPANMPKLGKYARLLGPRGLMPNPKSGTVTTDIEKAVKEAKAGRVEYRVDSTGIVHLGIGKVSFGADKLLGNFNAVMASIKANKPGSVKGNYILSIHLATTMGPSIAVNPSEA